MIRSSRQPGAVVILGVMAGLLGRANAQVNKVDPIDQARVYVDSALTAQAAGDFVTAISLYERANILAPHPVLQFNLAQAHRLADEKNPNPVNRDAARANTADFWLPSPAEIQRVWPKSFWPN
jgi:hypothetical protein